MSNRERWIIYPMLFFAIALATKAQLDQAIRLDTEELVCRQLTIVDEDGNARMRLVSDQHGGFLALYGQREMAAIVSASPDGGGRLQLSGTQRSDAISLIGNSFGGQVRIAGNPKQPVVVVGFAEDGSQSGLYALHDNQPLEFVAPVPPAAESNHLDWGIPLPQDASESNTSSPAESPQSQPADVDSPAPPQTSAAEPTAAVADEVHPEAAAAPATAAD